MVPGGRTVLQQAGVQHARQECSLYRPVSSQDGSGAHLQEHTAHTPTMDKSHVTLDVTEPSELLNRPLHLCKCRAQLSMEILKMRLFLQVMFQQNIPSELTPTGFLPSNGHPKEPRVEAARQ